MSEQPLEAGAKDLMAFYGTGRALALWDDKQAWSLRKEAEGNFYPDLLRHYGVESVVDVAAASGFHAFLLVQAGFRVIAIDGFAGFVEAGLRNQVELDISFPFLLEQWSDLNPALVNGKPVDAALCLGGSLHHTDRLGIEKLFANVRKLLRPKGIFVVEQRNYERLFRDRPRESTHPCGWRYSMDYPSPHDMIFRLRDELRRIDVRFNAIVTLEAELLPIAASCGFFLKEIYFDHGRKKTRDASDWLEYVFESG